MFNTPVLLIIFNREKETQQVFQKIRSIKPSELFVAADGPRPSFLKDREKCKKTREILNQIDWTCNVHTYFQKRNLGSGEHPIKAINWFFENVDEGIILEDDCIPDTSFFIFCENMLHRYSTNNRIMHIGGNNFLDIKSDYSYYYSNFVHCWGWATWKRAWAHYDSTMKSFPVFKQSGKINSIFNDRLLRKHWLNTFERCHEGRPDVWDYQWVYSIYDNGGICINPTVNLVSNIGFTHTATHTKNPSSVYAYYPLSTLKRIIHPNTIKINSNYDKLDFYSCFGLSIFSSLSSYIKRLSDIFHI